jgi:hypothetical protein
MSVLPFDVDVDEVGVTDVVVDDVGDGEVALKRGWKDFQNFWCSPKGY